MRYRVEIVPFLIIASGLSGVAFFLLLLAGMESYHACGAAVLLLIITSGYLFYFFRDPERNCTADDQTVVSPADGTIASVMTLSAEEFTRASSFCSLIGPDLARFTDKGAVVRLSIFLSLFDVHVNRAPISGEYRFLGYFKGKHLFTFDQKSSDVNQHNSILTTTKETCCLINQIVGPVCRRVVYWHDPVKSVPLHTGDRIGMMKFGSRLDLYFPAEDIEIMGNVGDIVRAGITPLATIRQRHSDVRK
jgi:phosphatidylserine decarboxylase